jgi:hypothetical protein
MTIRSQFDRLAALFCALPVPHEVRLAGVMAGVLTLLGVIPLTAQAAGLPLVISATIDYTHNTLTITGQNFGGVPVVTRTCRSSGRAGYLGSAGSAGRLTDTVGGNRTVSVGGNDSVNISASSTTTAGGAVVVKAGSSIALQAGGSIVQLNADGSITVQAAGNLLLEAGGTGTLKRTQVLTSP